MKKLKQRILSWVLIHLTSKMYRFIREQDILQSRGKVMYFRNKPMNAEQLSRLKEQVMLIKGLEAWKMILEDMRYQAQKKIFDGAKDEFELLSARAMLYNIDVLERKVTNLANLDTKR